MACASRFGRLRLRLLVRGSRSVASYGRAPLASGLNNDGAVEAWLGEDLRTTTYSGSISRCVRIGPPQAAERSTRPRSFFGKPGSKRPVERRRS